MADFKSVATYLDVLPETIQTYLLDNHLLERVQAIMVNPQFTNGRELMDSYHFPEDMAYNCIFFEGKSGHNLINIATLVPLGKRVDSKMIKKQLGLRDLHLMDKVKAEMLTEQSFGAFTPLALSSDWLLVMEPEVFKKDSIIIGAGVTLATLQIPTCILKQALHFQLLSQFYKE